VIIHIQARIKTLVCALILLFTSFPSFCQGIYWTEEAKAAYGFISELRIDESMNIIRLQSITHPDNLIWPYLEDYALFLQIFLQEDVYKIPDFLESSSLRSDRISVVSDSNPLSLMCQAQIHLHQCALRMEQSQFVSAATDLNQAFKLLKKNQKLHPDDFANLRLYALIKIAFGAIPDQYRWLVTLVTSLNGSIDEGLKELHMIIDKSTADNNIFLQETILLTALAETRLNNKPENGLQLLNKFYGKVPANRFIQYVMANVNIAAGNNEAAIKVLVLETGGPKTLKIPFMDFMLGRCKLCKGDEDADIYFKNFILFNKGKHYIKEAYQKLGWYSLLRGDEVSYAANMQQILLKGVSTTDQDQQAMREAETKEKPHPVLLRCRLLFDGGYYDQALAILSDAFFNSLVHQTQRLEFLYRKGRCLQAKKSYAEALHYYSLAMKFGEDDLHYFACSAALESGVIHETLGSDWAAAKFYNMCLNMSPETYSTSLHQKARTGLSRIGL
jgi:tetratricopeptide (TPR) repeat protein